MNYLIKKKSLFVEYVCNLLNKNTVEWAFLEWSLSSLSEGAFIWKIVYKEGAHVGIS